MLIFCSLARTNINGSGKHPRNPEFALICLEIRDAFPPPRASLLVDDNLGHQWWPRLIWWPPLAA